MELITLAGSRRSKTLVPGERDLSRFESAPCNRGGRERSLSPENLREALGMPRIRSTGFLDSLPFSLNDTTAGSETELQAAVSGSRANIDLPRTIEESNYFANLMKRAVAGDTSQSALTDLEMYLAGNADEVWENSWVRFPAGKLSPRARDVLCSDLLLNRRSAGGPLRADAGKFLYHDRGEEFLRVPISYLIKLALADVVGSQDDLPRSLRETGSRLMEHFSNDNTSPETFSFHVVPIRAEAGSGRALAKETAKRFLLTQLLVMYANDQFGLVESGQKAILYFSPHPPVRQKQLNECISDSFYRELFMSPCLSGWDNGQEKHAYMCLCHQVLSRSQLNAVAKLREAGIITRNLVVLPTLSNISLANNGTHISIGSNKLTRCVSDRQSGFGRPHEKYVGDLVIKIVEHFLPLFVGTYSAAPYRLDFTDFHPERVLGFLPHELDYTHLRMLWRRWKKKASLKVLGQPITPFGLKSFDRVLSAVFRLRGDFIPDFRLVDYPVSLMSTDRSPAFDGTVGNDERLKQDLADLGVFDTKMSLYVLYRLREYAKIGFSGFEGRHYSLFESLKEDMGPATSLQILITCLAFKYVLQGTLTHAHIPDDPRIESERRQVFFGAAVGMPTFYVREDTGNQFLKNILRRTREVRYSRRYFGYLRVYNRQFRLALAELIRTDAADLVEMLDLKETMKDLVARLERPERRSVLGKLTHGILADLGVDSPMKAEAVEFNLAAERYYRTSLRTRHMREAFSLLEEDFGLADPALAFLESDHAQAIRYALHEQSPLDFLSAVKPSVLGGTVSLGQLRKLIHLVLANTRKDIMQFERAAARSASDDRDSAPIRGTGNGENLYGTAVLG
jgi:hypothetical protein